MKTSQFLFKVGNGMGLFSDDMDYTSDFIGYNGYSEKFDISEIKNGGYVEYTSDIVGYNSFSENSNNSEIDTDGYDDNGFPFDYIEIYGLT